MSTRLTGALTVLVIMMTCVPCCDSAGQGPSSFDDIREYLDLWRNKGKGSLPVPASVQTYLDDVTLEGLRTLSENQLIDLFAVIALAGDSQVCIRMLPMADSLSGVVRERFRDALFVTTFVYIEESRPIDGQEVAEALRKRSLEKRIECWSAATLSTLRSWEDAESAVKARTLLQLNTLGGFHAFPMSAQRILADTLLRVVFLEPIEPTQLRGIAGFCLGTFSPALELATKCLDRLEARRSALSPSEYELAISCSSEMFNSGAGGGCASRLVALFHQSGSRARKAICVCIRNLGPIDGVPALRSLLKGELSDEEASFVELMLADCRRVEQD